MSRGPVELCDQDSFDSVLAGAKAGSGWAMEAIYRTFHRPVHAYLRAQLPAEADDLTSEVFVAVAGRVRHFTGDLAAFRSYVFTIAYRRLADHRRRQWRRPTEPLDAHAATADRVGGDAEADALASLVDDAMLRHIAALPRAQAQVVLLRVVADMSTQDVAAIVGKRPGAVRALQYRGLRRLAEVLGAPA